MAVLLLVPYSACSGHQDPYKMVCDVIYFAKSHMSSTLSNAVPSLTVTTTFHLGWTLPRIERFGGPFTTEQVQKC